MLGSDDPRPTGEGTIVLPQPSLLSADWEALATADLDRLVHAAFGARSFNLRRTIAKFFRYGATSIICFGISEVVLLVVSALGVGATVAAAIGTVSGIIPSYLLSRYWIWAEARRDRAARQVVQYWVISLMALTVTALSTGGIAKLAPPHGALHLFTVAAAFLFINVVCFVGKYLLYQRFIFVHEQSA